MSTVRTLAILALLLVLTRPANAAERAPALLDASVDGFAGTAAVVVSDTSGFRYARNDDVEFISASLYKLGVLVEAYRQAAAGRISLDSTLTTVGWEDLDELDGWYVGPGTTLTVRQALDWTITLSDNSTANALLRLLDPHAVNDAFTALGMTRTRLNTPLPWYERTALWNVTTARDMETLFAGLLAGRVVSPQASVEMIDLLARQRVNDRLPAGLPEGTRIAHKTGNLWDVAHDAGIVYTPVGPRIAVVLTAHYRAYADVVALASTVAAQAYSLSTRFSASLAPIHLPDPALVPGQVFATFQATNTGERSFISATAAARWLDAAGAVVREAPAVAIPALAPGASAIVVLRDLAPARGSSVLEVRVRDGDATGTALRLAVTVP